MRILACAKVFVGMKVRFGGERQPVRMTEEANPRNPMLGGTLVGGCY